MASGFSIKSYKDQVEEYIKEKIMPLLMRNSADYVFDILVQFLDQQEVTFPITQNSGHGNGTKTSVRTSMPFVAFRKYYEVLYHSYDKGAMSINDISFSLLSYLDSKKLKFPITNQNVCEPLRERFYSLHEQSNGIHQTLETITIEQFFDTFTEEVLKLINDKYPQ
jgi:hypothetical protein